MLADLYRRWADRWTTPAASMASMADAGAYGAAHHRRLPEAPGPMQVVSGRIDKPKVHFEAPPPRPLRRDEPVLSLVQCTSPAGETPLPALARAGLAHLYFESIHPFETAMAESAEPSPKRRWRRAPDNRAHRTFTPDPRAAADTTRSLRRRQDPGR